MPLDVTRARQYLRDLNFKALFIEELGWDQHPYLLDVYVDGNTYSLTSISQKRGMVAFVCAPMDDGRIPDYPTRRKIERQVARSVHEHLIIYTDQDKKIQIWQWVKRGEAGKPTQCREHTYYCHQPGDSLIQKLNAIAFSLDEEEGLTIVDVTGRVRAGFDLDRVTRRFYDRFKSEHDMFLKFLKCIPDEEMQRWYASVMLNRLMFIYFIQKKGFLDSNINYLGDKLTESKQRGKDCFYKDFLCPLFFEGFAKRENERKAAINQLLGKVPFLNGGIFQPHQLEELYGKGIQIADLAFEKLFDFFDQYHWHLDERPLRADNEINPDVLGYIFEKYVNQKQMGAYYTKEDITEYISKSTVIPYLFDAARQKCKIAFDVRAHGNAPDTSVWRLLQADPDRYIYDAVKKGVDLPLPHEIAMGLDDVAKRTEWNKPAPGEYALPTEIWREVVARRKRYEEIRTKLANGEIRDINDLITYNLNIRQFAQDVIENCEGPELLRAFWHAIVGRIPEKANEKFESGITILDPTCGSGAFLFAALNILDPLYEACLDRMEVFLDELERSGEKHRPEKFSDFRKVLERIGQHPNRRYFILKSIIVNNLYGVDIMEEAIEICKLRLFLKLVAQIERAEDVEPLPDIDFNIRAGNTLVGYATYDEVKGAVTRSSTGQLKMQFDDTMKRIDEKAQDVDRLFGRFRQQQTEIGGEVTLTDKQKLRNSLKALEDELNRYLVKEYGVDPNKKAAYDKWLASHKPFHWFIEFYGIVYNRGGFDVIIGNPPYVEYSKIRDDYTIIRGQYKTEATSNLYSFILERSKSLLLSGGSLGIILPLSAFCTQRMVPLIKLVKGKSGAKWIAHFGWRPAKLFEGVNIPLSILLFKPGQPRIYTTTFVKWYRDYRPAVFPTLQYVDSNEFLRFDYVIPKIGDPIERDILSKVFTKQTPLGHYQAHFESRGGTLFYRNTGGLYWRIFTDFQPFFSQNGHRMSSSTESTIEFVDKEILSLVTGILNSNLYWFFYVVFSSFHHVNPPDILEFPIDFDQMEITTRRQLLLSSKKLMDDMKRKSEIRQRIHKGGGISRMQTFFPSLSKSLNDEIDFILKKYYGFNSHEIDFIINYDIKYRMAEDREGD